MMKRCISILFIISAILQINFVGCVACDTSESIFGCLTKDGGEKDENKVSDCIKQLIQDKNKVTNVTKHLINRGHVSVLSLCSDNKIYNCLLIKERTNVLTPHNVTTSSNVEGVVSLKDMMQFCTRKTVFDQYIEFADQLINQKELTKATLGIVTHISMTINYLLSSKLLFNTQEQNIIQDVLNHLNDGILGINGILPNELLNSFIGWVDENQGKYHAKYEQCSDQSTQCGGQWNKKGFIDILKKKLETICAVIKGLCNETCADANTVDRQMRLIANTASELANTIANGQDYDKSFMDACFKKCNSLVNAIRKLIDNKAIERIYKANIMSYIKQLGNCQQCIQDKLDHVISNDIVPCVEKYLSEFLNAFNVSNNAKNTQPSDEKSATDKNTVSSDGKLATNKSASSSDEKQITGKRTFESMTVSADRDGKTTTINIVAKASAEQLAEFVSMCSGIERGRLKYKDKSYSLKLVIKIENNANNNQQGAHNNYNAYIATFYVCD